MTADEFDPTDVRLGCTINGIADPGRPHLGHAVRDRRGHRLPEPATSELEPGDLIATGTPARLAGPLGPDRHLEPGDVVTCWIEGIGELTTTIA